MEGFPPEPPAEPPPAGPPPSNPPPAEPPPAELPPAELPSFKSPPFEPPPPEPPFRPIPWEEPGKPFLPAITETIQLFATKPTEAFQRTPAHSELFRPLLYAIVLAWIGVLFTSFYDILFSATFLKLLPGLADTKNMAFETTGRIIVALMAPVFILFGVFISSAITHVMLMMLGGAGGGFSGTVRVQCYSTTASIAQAVPVAGAFVSLIWTIVLQVVGLSEMHRISRGKAAIAVLLPIGLCCTCAIIAIMVAGIGAFTALMGHK